MEEKDVAPAEDMGQEESVLEEDEDLEEGDLEEAALDEEDSEGEGSLSEEEVLDKGKRASRAPTSQK